MKFLLLILALLHMGFVSAQTLLIENATIVSIGFDGDPTPQDILVRDGKIAGIGNDLSVPAGAEVIEASGKTVAPGFFNAETAIGLTEINAVDGTRDSYAENDRITASLRVADAINGSSTVIPHNRSLGLTHALVQPESGNGLFAGTAAVIKLVDEDTVIEAAAGMVVMLGEKGSELAGGSRAAAMAILREAIEDARDYRANRDNFDRGNRRDYALSRHDLEALGPVIAGEMPLIVHVSRASDIEKLLLFAKKYKLKLIISGAAEAWRVAEKLAAQKVPIILDPIYNLPTSYEAIGARLDNAKLLHDAGVTLLFTGMGWQNTHNAFLVRQSAGNAVANGLPYMAAIAAITSNPASVFGIKGYGEIKVGNDASLVIWSGDPLELSSSAEVVIVNGKRYSLQSRAIRLRDRYWQRYRPAG
ncbi:MAG: amidohydrolase family protein [Arenicella sp.]|nr:amidohydrolase family protein [Arenicella sp.]